MTVVITHDMEGVKRYTDVKYIRVNKDYIHIRYRQYNPIIEDFEYRRSIIDRCYITNMVCDYVQWS